MKLQSVNLIFVLGVIVQGFAETVGSLCLIRNTTEANEYWYQCSLSTNCLSDVEAAPIDISRISFSTSKFEIIRNRSFARLGNVLIILQIYSSEIGEIEDNAFEGLGQLHTFEIVGTRLEIIKGVWFKGLTNLKKISLQADNIKRIENSFFTTVPQLGILDISQNKVNCLPVESFAGFRTREFRTAGNEFSMVCLVPLINWLKEHNVSNSYTERHNLEIPADVVSSCAKKIQTPKLDETLLRKCIGTTLMDFLLPQENYTVKQLCESLKNKPSPYLNCSM